MNNTYIQNKADDLLKGTLRDLFYNRKCELGEFEANQKFEKGIDFFFEVFNEKTEHTLLFLNQNKGTQGDLIVIKNENNINYNKISFQIDLRHAEYFYLQLDEPIIFTICDLKRQTIYWYDIQNDSTLPERIFKQKEERINKIQIYIPQENILDELNFERLLSKIDYAKYNQIRKKKAFDGLEADYSLTETGSVNKKMIDKILYTINLFEGIKVLPENVICQLYPFKGSSTRTIFCDLGFETDNVEFFNFMNSIVLENDKLRTLDNSDLDENDKLREIIDFFQINNIYHIRWSGNTFRKQICLHDLFHYAKCECERCNLERLNLVETQHLLNTQNTNSSYEHLRRGYTYYLLGDYIKSYEIFYKIYSDANKNQNPINFTISTYNLIKLRGFIKSYYYEDDRNEIIDKLENIRFDNDERFVKEHAPYFIDVYKNIKEQKFYDNVFEKVDESFLKIQKIHYRDKHGASESNSPHLNLQSSFIRFNSYLHHNFIIFNHYQEYTNLTKKILESLFVLHSLKNTEAKKYEVFDWYALDLWIFYADEEFITYLLQKYDITILEVSKDVIEKLSSLVDNLLNSHSEFSKHSSIFSSIKLDKILNNIVAIIALINVEYSRKEFIISKILDNIKKLSEHHLVPFSGLYLYATREKLVKKKSLKKIVDIFILSNKRYGYVTVLENYFEICTPEELRKLISKTLKLNDLREVNVKNEYFEDLLYSFSLLDSKSKNILKYKFNEVLDENFDLSLYIDLLLYDLIDFNKDQFDKNLSYITDMSNFDESRFPFHSFQNLNLYNIMSVVFKYNLEIDEKLKSQISKVYYKEKDYFEWLMSIENYDYSKFNSYWILKSQTLYYKERFKKSERLRNEIAKSLKENYIEGLAKLYFKEFV